MHFKNSNLFNRRCRVKIAFQCNANCYLLRRMSNQNDEIISKPKFQLTDKMGMILSFAMACNRRGAPVSDCRPAPIVDMNAPSKTTHLLGQDNNDTINSFPTLSPNLQIKTFLLFFSSQSS